MTDLPRDMPKMPTPAIDFQEIYSWLDKRKRLLKSGNLSANEAKQISSDVDKVCKILLEQIGILQWALSEAEFISKDAINLFAAAATYKPTRK